MATSVPRGVTAPLGFVACGVRCGIKPNALDLALVVASDPDRPASAAALFTTNLVKAAPVLVSREHLAASGGRARAVLINSGCANACTGEDGMTVARDSAATAAFVLDVPAEQVLLASTGVIGVALDARKISAGVADAAEKLAREAHLDAARAIMTTDREPKEAAIQEQIGGRAFRVGGMAKGAGMIEPNMATMLAVMTTDVAIEPSLLQQALKGAADETFNAITIDGDTSTNDTVFALASGASEVTIGPAELPVFQATLTAVCRALAVAIVRGGEGVTRMVSIHVAGAASAEAAKRVAKTVANSLLVKTAVHGADPNWGRILAAAGRAGVAFQLNEVAIRIGPVVLFSEGCPHDERASQAAEVLARDEVEIGLTLGRGAGAATVYTCDLSQEYVRINGEYRT